MAKEYIEREAFIEILKETKNDCEHYADKMCCDFAIMMVNLMPTADVQEVRHANWVKIKDKFFSSTNGRGGNIVKCSICGEPSSCGLSTPYCSICGAKMVKE